MYSNVLFSFPNDGSNKARLTYPNFFHILVTYSSLAWRIEEGRAASKSPH